MTEKAPNILARMILFYRWRQLYKADSWRIISRPWTYGGIWFNLPNDSTRWRPWSEVRRDILAASLPNWRRRSNG